MMRRLIVSTCALALLAACDNQGSETRSRPMESQAASIDTRAMAEDGRLVAFLDALWEERVALSPEYQTRLGRKTSYDRWDDRSPEAQDREIALLEEQLRELERSFDRNDLTPDGQLNYDLFVANTKNQIALDQFRLQRFPLSQFRGIHSRIPVFLSNDHKIDDLVDAEAYISRVQKVDRVLSQAAAQLEARVEAGYTLPEFSYPLIADSAAKALSGDAIRRDFARKVEALDLPEEQSSRLIAGLEDALAGPYARGYRDFERRVRALAQRTQGSGNLGISRFDSDGSFYSALLRNYTTTDLSADEIHELGLAEVARIQEEMRAIMAEIGVDGSLEEFFGVMRTSEDFYLSNDDEGREAYLALARGYIEGFEPRLGELFGIRPEAEVEVRRVEPFRERSAGKAFYSQPDEEGTRPGYFYANLAKMEDMPTYQLEALVYHEAIPGHHMQRALQIEQQDLPLFRRFGSATAYTEGWGLYSELLPKEIGFYEDPYSDFGRLAMELWRAARLVVDTGLHAKGWTMQEAIDYLQQNTPNPDGDTVKAIERYIVYPGQATAYKIGMLKILELRAKARSELGERFDIREFHDTILRAGPLPLDVLEDQIDLWIESERNA